MGSNGVTEIAIVGMGCRFPGGASNPDAYWDLLRSGQDATCELPAERWSQRRFHDPDNGVAGKALTKRGGYLRESIRAFDADFFGISPREAESMDPQQRLLLEVAWEAFEDAGIVADDIRGSRTGVYVGGFTTDNLLHQLNVLNLEAISSHTAVSATLVMLSNRLSYVFDLRGPSMTVDTACSSSLVALHLAVQALRAGECTMALAGGVNVMFRPAYSIAMSKGGFLSPDGRCKSFDARGDGYGRGEGAGLLVLKPLADAMRDGDRVHAVIVETGVNQDGRTDGITLPSRQAQIALIREVYGRAGIDRDAVAYVEAHGTGTRAGDVVELNALAEAIAQGRDPALGPLLVGSAKSNLGHLEAAAGVAGVIKTVLALRHATIPPSLHFTSPPDSIDLDGLGLAVATELRAWPTDDPARLASVNSFGYGGTNAHAVLRAASPPSRRPAPSDDRAPERPWLLPLSARSERSLSLRIGRLHQRLTGAPGLSLRDLGYTLARRRAHLPYRAAIFAASTDEALDRLKALADFRAGDLRPTRTPVHRSPVPVAFVYTGMGAQSWGMGRGLPAADPAAARALEACDAIWQALSGWSLHELFARGDGAPMTEPAFAQPANFAVQVMLTEIARGHGLRPSAVVGHSAGEMASAWAAGSLSLEDALRVTWHRSRLQQRCDGRGRMLAVGASGPDLPADLRAVLDLAAVNGPAACVLAGEQEPIAEAASLLESRGIVGKVLPVGVAYHSRQMEPLGQEFLGSLAGLDARAPEIPLYSTVTGGRIVGAEQDAAYWWRNLRERVEFASAVARMVGDGLTLFHEIGPHPALSPAVAEILRAAGQAGTCHPSLRRGEDDHAAALQGVAACYVGGAAFDWERPYPAGDLVPLLPYPWDREELWAETAISRADRLGSNDHPFVGRRVGEAVSVWEGDFKRVEHAFLLDHRIEGAPIFPASGHVELALAARIDKSGSSAIEDLRIERALETFATPIVRVHVEGEGDRFTVFCRENRADSPWIRVARGGLVRAAVPPREPTVDRAAIEIRCPVPLDVPGFYETAARHGIAYGPAFQCLQAGWLGEGECLVRLSLRAADEAGASAYFLHPVLLDGGLQSVLALRPASAASAAGIALPVGFDQLRYHGALDTTVWCHARQEGEAIDLRLFDEGGTTRAELFGLRSRPAALGQAEGAKERLYRTVWVPAALPDTGSRAVRRCLVLADTGGLADEIASAEATGPFRFVTIDREPRAAGNAGGSDSVGDAASADLVRLLDDVDLGSFDDILYLRALDLPDDLTGPDDAVIGLADGRDLLVLLQRLAALDAARPPALTVCTCAAQAVAADETGGSAPGQAALWGALRAARLELAQLRIRSIDLASRLPGVGARQVLAELAGEADEPEVAYRLGQRYAARIAPLPQERYRGRPSRPGQGFALATWRRGSVVRRGFVETETAAPSAGEVAIAVVSIGLGPAQRAVLRNLRPDEAPVFEQQCVGTITAIGEGVSGLSVGQRVLALVERSPIRSRAAVAADRVIGLPADLGEDDGGGLFDWLVAHDALFGRARLEPGQWLLVCDACGDVALAATRLALAAGARVIATAESEEERGFLRGIGCTRVIDAATLAFRDEALRATQGHGLDAAFCRLTGAARLAALDALRPGGVYLDLSAIDPNATDAIPIRCLDRDIAILRVTLVGALRQRPAAVRAALDALIGTGPDLLRDGAAAALPVRRLSVRDIDFAFKAALQSRRPGRTALVLNAGVSVLPRRSTLTLDPAATYLVTGGFGGIGLAVLDWLAECGARSLAVISRSGPSAEGARARLDRLAGLGLRVVSLQADMADPQQVGTALDRLRRDAPPIRGVVHGAGALADASIPAMDAEGLDRAMGAKARGALHLHRHLTDVPLDFFVCHGSIAASWGNAGQYNYAGANGFLAGLVRHRRAAGLAATCINWGPVAEAGMAARDPQLARHLSRLGLESLPQATMIEILQDAIVEGWDICDAADILWDRWRAHAPARERGRIADLVGADAPEASGSAEAFRRALAGRGRNERRAAIFEMLVDVAAPILKMPKSRIAATASLGALGTDSLMAVEIIDGIQTRTGLRPRVLFLINSPSLQDLAEKLEAEVYPG